MAFEIVQVQRDDEGICSYLERIKSFRLFALQNTPQFFGSTYEREAAFTDETWYDRLANPKATHFVALRGDKIACLLVLIELPVSPEESKPSADPRTLSGDNKDSTQLHCRVNGMFTLPEARGQGIAKALLERALKYGEDEAKKAGKTFVATIVVDSDNPIAIALYKRCGFAYMLQEPVPFNRTRDAVMMKYGPVGE